MRVALRNLDRPAGECGAANLGKRIASAADLAINGAPPAFAEPLHVGRPNIASRARFLELIGDMLDRCWLSNDGPLVQDFERRIAAHLGVGHVVATCNGTIALEIAIRALALTGEVIVPSYTFVATAHAVSWQGLTPVFADIDPSTHCLDPEAVRALITPRTSGVIAVHLWGRSAPIAALEAVCAERGLALLFDAAHAFGASYGNRSIGNFGACEVFSFHATKFLNSLEGGAIATNDVALAEKMRLMRNFGFAGYDNVIHPGTNGKMVEACAAMGIANLEAIDAIVAANERNHRAYAEGLACLPGVRLLRYDGTESNNRQYIVAEIGPEFGCARDEVVAALHAENILARRYFWPGCHRMQPYRDLYPWADAHLPHTNGVAARVVVLPTGMAVGEEEIATICAIFEVLHATG
jgi:dTDP-4-amino-4,6-dideoxygalactose transaminase